MSNDNDKSVLQLTGPCDDDDMFECDNGWCIDKKFTCLSLNPCGDKSDCRAAEKTVMDYILMGAKYLSIILSVAAACYMLIRYCKSRRRRHSTFEDIQIFTWCHRKLCCSGPRDQVRTYSLDCVMHTLLAGYCKPLNP